jgi:hypothetical protein
MDPQVQALAQKFVPYMYFHENENYFPITIDSYLSVCQLNQNSTSSTTPDLTNFTVLEEKVTPAILGNYTDPTKYANTYLSFSNPNYASIIGGDSNNTTTYCKIVDLGTNSYAFIYFFVYQQVAAYPFCGCCCCNLTSYMHLGDIKAVIVYVTDGEVLATEFAAHGDNDGAFIDSSKMEFRDSHPIVYCCLGDHSTYYNEGIHPRIFGIVYDRCSKGISSIPNVIFVDNNTQWCNYAGAFNNEGISAPSGQIWWDLQFPTENTNNWFKRLFCPSYW